MNSLFCRHNRFTADCPICSKGTVLDAERGGTRERRPAPARPKGESRSQREAAPYSGPYSAAGPYESEQGERYEVRLERVPGGVRLAQWSDGRLERRAPVLPAQDLHGLVAAARERHVLGEPESVALAEALDAQPGGHEPGGAEFGASRARSGDMQEELRVEPAGADRVRIGRWMLRPGAGWELQEAPVMLPVPRYAEALRDAGRRGLLGQVSEAGGSARP